MMGYATTASFFFARTVDFFTSKCGSPFFITTFTVPPSMSYHKRRDGSQNFVLNGSLERPCTVLWVVALIRKPRADLRGKSKRNAFPEKALDNVMNLIFNDTGKSVLAEHIEDNYFIKTI
jgi:hypothetical protein